MTLCGQTLSLKWLCRGTYLSTSSTLIVKELGVQDYQAVWQEMIAFTNARHQENIDDQLWLVEHPAVFTQGQAGKAEHILSPGDIPIVQSDRGGQVTYHGPGQLVVYPLLDLRQRGLGVRDLVTHLERTLIKVLSHFSIDSYAKADAPGVYVQEMKIASLGLRIRRGCSFHGLCLNVNMDLSPFDRINPCGYEGMAMTDMARLIPVAPSLAQVKSILIDRFVQELGYKGCIMARK